MLARLDAWMLGNLSAAHKFAKCVVDLTIMTAQNVRLILHNLRGFSERGVLASKPHYRDSLVVSIKWIMLFCVPRGIFGDLDDLYSVLPYHLTPPNLSSREPLLWFMLGNFVRRSFINFIILQLQNRVPKAFTQPWAPSSECFFLATVTLFFQVYGSANFIYCLPSIGCLVWFQREGKSQTLW